ncbi:MAG: ROK family transcriptional regulator [Actinobacteria bacterium]|nr:ROK family transcriptional regulator [Actinomycetota bacterium]MCG2801541.1 ROK family transcriptional regulator [Cellulomonas sp.]
MSRAAGGVDVTRTAVLAHIGAQGPTSRADLARSLDVSSALITQLTKQLIADGLLEELEQVPSQGGRPARLLGLTSAAGNAVGVKVVADHVTLVEVGIDGEVARAATEAYDAFAPDALTRLSQLVGQFLAGTDRPLLGIGVGLPGNVDVPSRGVVDSSQLRWSQYPVGPTLRRDHGLPVLVENNVNALTLAQTLYGQGRHHETFLVVTLGTGIGGGLVAEGTVLRGGSGSAGQIGHVPVEPDGPVCQCGNEGCLEALIGEQALLTTARARGVLAADDPIEVLHARATDGDEGARAVLAEAGRLLGRTLAGIVNVLDPELLILLGEGVAGWPHWATGFDPAFRRGLLPHLRGLEVSVEQWQDDRWAQGAACLVLATPFETDGRSGEQGRLVRQRLVDQTAAGGRR